MATTINSGYANSPKLTANIADHADVYGGRALVFDGVADYLEVDQTFTTDNFALSFWINPNDVTSNKYLFDQNAGLCRSVVIGYQDGYINFINDDDDAGNYYPTGTEADTQIPVSVGEWQHYVMMTDGTKVYGYRNGAEIVNVTGKWGASGAEKLWIGKYEGGLFYEGKMTDVKIFDTALTEAQVQELYIKPENTPSAVQDNLVAWYPMCEGNPESPQSIVYDHSEKKLGSDFARAVTADNWTAYTNMTVNTITDGVSIVAPTTASGVSVSSNGAFIHFRGGTFLGENQLTTKNLEIGKIYSVTFNAFYSGGASGVYADIYNSSESVFSDEFTTTNTSYTMLFNAKNATTGLLRFQQMKLDNTVYITNISVKEVLMGNHATTNFFGDMSDILSSTQKTNMDAILESDDNNFDFSDTAGNQVTQSTLGSEELGTWTNHSTSGWDTFTSSGTSITSAISDASGTHIATNPFSSVSGKIYKITFNLTLNSGTAPEVSIRETTSGTVGDGLGIGTSSEGVNTYYFNAISTKTLYLFFNINDTASNWSASSVSIKEITTTKFFPLFGSDEINGNTLQLRNAGTTKAHIALPFTTVVGKSYSAEIKLTTANMQGGLSVSDDIAENTLSTASLSGSIITSNTLVATGTTSYVHIKNNQTNNNQYNLYDNLKVREVGISSSGFETAVNEPVVPQVPLMKYNQKMFFDGVTSQYVSLGSQSMSGNEQTISAWIVINGFVDTTPTVITFGKTMLQMNSSTITYYPNVQTGTTLSVSKALIVKKLYHIVVTKDSSGNGKLYLNGVLEETDTSLADINNDSASSYIGRYSSDYFDGTIDDVSIFNTALTQTQVQELFNDGVALDATTHSKADDHLLGYWRNDGVTTWIDRGDIQAIGFDGSDDYIDCGTGIGNFLGDNYNNSLSVSMWFRADTLSNGDGLFDLTPFDGSTLGEFTISIFTNKIQWNVDSTSWNLKSDTLSTNTWYHLVCVLVSEDDTNTKMYLNGQEVTNSPSASLPSASRIDFNGKKTIIGGKVGTSNLFDGFIGQTAIWNKELSSTEVSEIYNLGRRTDLTTSYSNNLKGYWLLNPTHSNPDLTGTDKILDRSGNGNHGTQNGGVNFLGTNDGTVQGSPDSITIREGLNSNRDGLGFYFTNPSSNVLRLNGSNDFVTIDSTGSLPSGDQSRSITCWIKPSSLSGDQPIIFTGTYSSNQMFTLAFLSANPTKISVWGHSNDNTGTDVLTTDNWWYVGVTYDSGTNTLKSYIGGGANNIDPALDINNTSTTDYNTTYGDVRIGRASTQDKYFDGIVDEVKIYNRALSANEILKDFKHQKGKHKND